MLGDVTGVDFQDFHAALLIGQGNLNLSIETARSQQGRVERIGSVGRHDEFGLSEVVETVHLVQQFHQRTLDFSIGRRALRESTTTDGVDFVHENNTRFMLLCVAYQPTVRHPYQ